MAGALIVSLPAVLTTLAGCLFVPDDILEFFENLLTDEEFLVAMTYLIAIVVCSLCLSAYFSLFTKFGAIPLTLFVVWFLNVAYWLLLYQIGVDDDAGPFVGIVIHLIVSVVVSEAMVHKLSDLAARGE